MSIQIVFEAVDKAALATLQKVAKGVDGVTEAEKKNKTESNLLNDVYKNLFSTMSAANIASGLIAKAFDFFVQTLKLQIKEAGEAELALARLDATLISTGRSTSMTAQGLADMAQEMSKGTTFDDEQILEAMNTLLRFDSVTQETLPDITQTAMDMAAALGTNVSDAANQLGGALETGVIPRAWKLDTATKENIKSMIEMGNESEALGVMLDALGQKFDGQAEKMGSTAIGASERVKIAWNDLAEAEGESNLQMSESFNIWLADYLSGLAEEQSANNELVATLRQLGVENATYSKQMHSVVNATDEQIAAAKRLIAYAKKSAREDQIEVPVGVEVDDASVQAAVDDIKSKFAMGTNEQFNFIMSFQSNFDSFEKDRDELLAKMEETRDKILAIREQMAGGQIRQSEGDKQIATLAGEMEELSNKVNANKADWDEWQNKAIFAIIQTKLAADGLTDIEFDQLLKIGEDMGILDPAVIETAKKTMEEVNKILSGEGATDKNAAVTNPLNVIKEITPDTVASVQGVMTAITGVDPGNLEAATDNIKYLVAQDGRTIKIYVEQTTTTVAGQAPSTAPSTSTTTAMNAASYIGQGVTLINYGTIRVDSLGASDLLAEFR